MSSSTNLQSIVGSVEERFDGGSLSLGALIDAVGTRSLGPMLLLPAALAMTPVGGIPGVPTLIAIMLLLIVTYWFISGESLWMPKIIRERSIDAEKVSATLDTLRPAAEWTDQHFGDHLQSLVRPSTEKTVAVLVALLAVLMPPLELLPFAVAVPAGAIALMALGLTLRDGALLLVGFAVTATVPLLALWLIV